MTSPLQQLLCFEARRDGSIDARFATWARNNPEVLALFERYSLEAIQAGHRRYSADLICARIRWHVAIETRGEDFKLNDHFTSRLARWFMERHPQHAGVFATRELRGRERWST